MMKPRLLTLLLLWLLVLPVQANESTSNCSSGPNLSSLGAEQQIQLVYVGLLSRAADAPGLNYWINNLNDGFSIEKLRENIVCCQAEYLNGLGNLNRSDLVTSLYQNLFNRSPRDEGKAYWVSGGGSNVSADRLVLALINGAGCTDQYALLNKAEAASYYTSNYTTYDKTEAASAVSDVDSTEASLQAAKDLIDSLGNVDTSTPFAPNSSARYRVQYSSKDGYSVGQPGSNCSGICENFDMTVSFYSTGRKENGRDIISAQYKFYDGTRTLEFYYDQNGTLRQLSSWDGRFDQFDYRARVWGAPFIVAQSSIASGNYDVGIGLRTQIYAKKNLEGRLTNTGLFTTEVPAFSGPVLVSVIELRGEMTWQEADTEYPEGSKADVYHRIAWSDDYGIVWLEKTMEIYESTITGGFLNPVEIYESWEMIEKP